MGPARQRVGSLRFARALRPLHLRSTALSLRRTRRWLSARKFHRSRSVPAEKNLARFCHLWDRLIGAGCRWWGAAEPGPPGTNDGPGYLGRQVLGGQASHVVVPGYPRRLRRRERVECVAGGGRPTRRRVGVRRRALATASSASLAQHRQAARWWQAHPSNDARQG